MISSKSSKVNDKLILGSIAVSHGASTTTNDIQEFREGDIHMKSDCY